MTYTEQTLTTDQQMQARKNQGLYYEMMEDVPLLENESLTAVDNEGIYVFDLTSSFSFAFTLGDSYTVIFDGDSYSVTAKSFNTTSIIIGNESLSGSGEDTGEPFLFASEVSRDGTLIFLLFVTIDGNQHTVTIIERATVTDQIDPKYLSNFPVLIDKYPNRWEEGDGKKYWEAYIAGRPVVFTAGINLDNNPGCGIVLSASENFERFMYLTKKGTVMSWDGSTSSLTSEIQLTKAGIEDEINTYYYDYIDDEMAFL